MNNSGLEICHKSKSFIRRDKIKVCRNHEHLWRVILFLPEYNPVFGMAICCKCGLLEGGFVVDGAEDEKI